MKDCHPRKKTTATFNPEICIAWQKNQLSRELGALKTKLCKPNGSYILKLLLNVQLRTKLRQDFYKTDVFCKLILSNMPLFFMSDT